MLSGQKLCRLLSQATVVRVPNLGASPLCPFQAFGVLLTHIPASRNHSLFSILPALTPPSHVSIRLFLKKILTTLNIDPSIDSFHCFRPSGTTYAYTNNIPLQAIKSHGTWCSDSIHLYIASSLQHTSSVYSTFRLLLQST